MRGQALGVQSDRLDDPPLDFAEGATNELRVAAAGGDYAGSVATA